MKNENLITSILLAAIIITVLATCTPDPAGPGDLVRRTQLKELIVDFRHYFFYYGRNGRVDSILAFQDGSLMYQYKVSYTGSKIDSASLIEDGGVVVSSNKDIQYDRSGRIIQFNYTQFIPGVPEPFENMYNITYDNMGNLQTIYGIEHDSIVYDNQHNITTWINTGGTSAYTSDDKLNPLYFIDNFFVIVTEEHFFWESSLGKHNFVTKKYPNGYMARYRNEYDSKDRLIRKVTMGDGESSNFEFIYHN